MYKNLFITILVIALSSCKTDADKRETPEILKANESAITIMVDGNAFPWEIAEDRINFHYSGKSYDLSIQTDLDTLDLTLHPGVTKDLDFVMKSTDTIRVNFIAHPNPAKFDSTYISNSKGNYEVYLPEVHELVNIAVALTQTGKKDSNMVNMESDYYTRVMDHFEPYTNHPLIDTLNTHITTAFGDGDHGASYDYYYNIRVNANMYEFDKDGIANNSPYSALWGGDQLHSLIPLLEDFAETSGFRKFYAGNQAYYDTLIDQYYQLVPVNKMWDWIEARFPQRYDAYKVYFSPLVGGAHCTEKFSGNGYRETLMFIDAPIFSRSYSDKEKEAILSRIVFTEIDHNYVNPTTDSYTDLSVSMTPLECWNNGSQGYQSAYLTFNEYMTWALFSIYLYDHFDKDIFEQRNKAEANFMADGRGFLRFREFNDFVLEWYKQNPDRSLTELYPAVMQWMKDYPCEDNTISS